MNWVNDSTRLEEEVSFLDGTTKRELIQKLEEATTSKKCRKYQKKVGEYLVTNSFQVWIKTDGQWDLWLVEL